VTPDCHSGIDHYKDYNHYLKKNVNLIKEFNPKNYMSSIEFSCTPDCCV
jgi:hypothetical protein